MAFGSNFRTWYSDIPELKKKGEDEGELLGLLNHTMQAIELSFYYLFFKVCVCVCVCVCVREREREREREL